MASTGVLAQLKVLIGADIGKLKSGLDEAAVTSERSAKRMEGSFHTLGSSLSRLMGPLSETGRQVSVAVDAIGASAAESSKMLSGLGSALSLAGGIGIGAMVALSGVTVKLFDNLEKTAHAAEGVGMGVSQYVELTEALKVYDVNQEQANQALAYFDKILSGLVRSKAGITAIQELGLNLQTLQKMNPHDALLAIADAFSKLQDGTQKAGIAAALFENTYGIKLIPFLNQGRAGIEKLEARFTSLGSAMANNAAAAENLSVAWHGMVSSLEAVTLETSNALGIPVMLEAIAHPLLSLKALVLDFGSVAVEVFADVAEGIGKVVNGIDWGLSHLHLPTISTAGLSGDVAFLHRFSSGLRDQASLAVEGIVASPEGHAGSGGIVAPKIPAVKGIKEQTDALAGLIQQEQSEISLLKVNTDKQSAAQNEYRRTIEEIQKAALKTHNLAEEQTAYNLALDIFIRKMEAAHSFKVESPDYSSFVMPSAAGVIGGLKTPTLTLSQLSVLPDFGTRAAQIRALTEETQLSSAAFARLAAQFPGLTEEEVAATAAGQKFVDTLSRLDQSNVFEPLDQKFKDVAQSIVDEGYDLGGKLANALGSGIEGFENQLTSLIVTGRTNWMRLLQSIEGNVVHSFIQKGVSGLLGHFGLGGGTKPDGTANNPLYVTMTGPGGGALSGVLGPLGGIVPTFPGGKGGGILSTIGGLFKGSGGGILGTLGKIGSVFAGFLAGGGDVTPGKAYVVGEKHPEFFVPKASGRVVPTVKTGGNKPMIYSPTFNIQTPNADSFRRSQSQLLTEGYRHRAATHARNS